MLPYGGFGEARIFRQRFLRRITQALVVGAVAQLYQNKTLPLGIPVLKAIPISLALILPLRF
ncbi:hypothetical protein [Neisseria gonorrhoeae]|uniref:hypothetical protein n=1 Tax=Neisseria gonorrhoeae TaxID=485 RepID=UPI00387AEAE9